MYIFHSATCTLSTLEHVHLAIGNMYMFHLSILVSLELAYTYPEAYTSGRAGLML